VFFGGGPVMIEAIDIAKEFSWSIHVFSAKRQMDNILAATGETLREALESREIETVETSKLNTTTRALIPSGPSVIGLSFDAAWIFPSSLIATFNGALFNSHGMRLPQNRGAGGFTWGIQRGTRVGYSLFHQVTPGIDDGAVAFVREYVFPSNCKLPEDYFRIAAIRDSESVREFMELLESGDPIILDPQPEYLSLYFPRVYTPINGAIDWSTDSESIAAFVDSFDAPYPGAFSFIDDSRVSLSGCTITQDGPFHPFQAGIVYRQKHGVTYIATRSRGLRFNKVVVGSHDNQSRIRVGDRLATPARVLGEARSFRPIIGPNGLVNVPHNNV
jgi:methionyl-tRNA formyltransferase